MLITKNTGYKEPLAMGLLWTIATPSEINELKENEDKPYGFIKSSEHGKQYRMVTFTEREHKGAISFAGLLAYKYENLIFIHQLNNEKYWLCIIHKHQVWSEVSLTNRFTAGDIICHYEKADEIIQWARHEIFGTDDEVLLCSERTAVKFPGFTAISLLTLLENTQKDKKNNRILLLEKYQLRMKRTIVIAVMVGCICFGLYSLYASYSAAAIDRQRIAQAALQAQHEKQEKVNFINAIQQRRKKMQGPIAITKLMMVMAKLPVESAGWHIADVDYELSQPEQLRIKVNRTQYGNILTFHKSYQQYTQSEEIATDNNHGEKRLQITLPAIPYHLPKVSNNQLEDILSSDYPMERYKIISYAQLGNLQYHFEKSRPGQYYRFLSKVSFSGENLWGLSKMKYFLQKFPTLFIDQISLKVKGLNITWKMQGELYG